MTNLTPTQTTILQAASLRLNGDIEPLPSKINTGIKPRVIKGLENRGLITQRDGIYCISAAGFAAIGATPLPAPTSKPKARRENTKQARMIALMQRPEGASVEEICQETGWKAHTVRGVFSHTLRKRLGLTILSDKGTDQIRRYRVSQESADDSEK